MIYQEILSKQDPSILITGDSLSYNRYGYDSSPRANAFDCGVGMPCWSFLLRDRIYRLDRQFIFGDCIEADCAWIPGIDNTSDVPHTAAFGGRVKTLYPEDTVSFSVPIKSDRIVLYLQYRSENSCVFDACVDGNCAAKDVNTLGSTEAFAGYGLFPLVLPCEPDLERHTVEFFNIRGTSPKITLAGAGSRHYNIALTGRGSTCADYFIENFEERIGRYKPDLLILLLGANDRAYRTIDATRINLIKLFSKIFACSPECKILYLLPPSSHCPQDPGRDVLPYTSLLTAEAYNRTMEAVCRNLGKDGYNGFGLNEDRQYDIESMRISDLFDDQDVSSWRFDNIHLNPHGNQVLLDALCKKLGLP